MPVAHQASATTSLGIGSTAAPLNLPTTFAGELLIAHISVANATGTLTLTGPAGWTKQGNIAVSTTKFLDVWTKTSAGETGTATWTKPNANDTINAVISSYAGVDPAQQLDVVMALSAPSPVTNPSSPSLTTITANTMLVCGLATGGGTTITVPSGMQSRANFNSDVGVADQTVAAIGATGTRQWTISAATTVATSSIALRAAADPIQLRPDSDSFVGSWTPVGAATLSGAINEVVSSDAEYIQSAVAPVNDMTEVMLQDPSSIGSGTFTIVVRARK